MPQVDSFTDLFGNGEDRFWLVMESFRGFEVDIGGQKVDGDSTPGMSVTESQYLFNELVVILTAQPQVERAG